MSARPRQALQLETMTAEEAAMLPQRAQAALAITLIALVGTCLGVFLPATASMPQPWGTLSAILGALPFAHPLSHACYIGLICFNVPLSTWPVTGRRGQNAKGK